MRGNLKNRQTVQAKIADEVMHSSVRHECILFRLALENPASEAGNRISCRNRDSQTVTVTTCSSETVNPQQNVQ